MNPTAQLVRDGQILPGGQAVPVGSDGTRLVVTVPAGLQLTGAELRLTAPDDSAPVSLLSTALATTDLGAGAPPADEHVQWASYDWGARRALVKLSVTLAAGADADHMRLRVSDGGPWILASPGSLVPLAPGDDNVKRAVVFLPGLSASRLLIELVTKTIPAYSPEDHPFAATSKIAAVELTGARRPPALTVTAGEAIVHHEPGLLPPGGSLSVPLLAALRDLLPGHAGGVAELRLVAPADSVLQRIDLSLRARRIVTRFTGDAPAVAGDVPAGGELVGQVTLAQAPVRVRARVRAEPRNEYRLPVPPRPQDPRLAHRCTPDSALAQAFAVPPGDALLGASLLLGPRTAALRGRLAFHADDRGVPQATPFAAIDLALDALAGHGVAPAARPVEFDLPEPALPPGELVWVSLVLHEGEALWFLGQAEPRAGARALLRRERGEPWVPRDMPLATGLKDLWACAELLLRRPTPPDPPRLALRWAEERPFSADPAGRVDLAEGALPPAPQPPQSVPLRLVASCSFAARVELAELAVDLPEASFDLSFGT